MPGERIQDADVSTITWVIPRAAFYGYLEAFVRAGLGRQKRDILYNNAAQFLRLEESNQ
jgi:hypothetical protein